MPHSGAPLGRVRILLVEDSELDAELLIEQLLEAGLDAEFLRVDGAEDMRAQQPVADNADPEGRARNRRVEMAPVPKSSTNGKAAND